MSPTPFAELLDRIVPGDAEPGVYSGHLTDDWLQGRAGFGGLMAAIAVTALRRELGAERPLRALLTAFVGPPGAGDLRIECRTLRSGKSVTWAEARILQNNQVCTTVSACFGGGRDSGIHVPAADRPPAQPPEQAQPFPYLPGVTPEFIQHFELRWGSGHMPVSGAEAPEMGMWLRFAEPGGFGENHVVALMDVLPPAVMTLITEMKPISSLTWHLELLDDLQADDALDGSGWWFFHVFAQAAANGYSQQHATLYTPSGRAIAMSQQAIAVFA